MKRSKTSASRRRTPKPCLGGLPDLTFSGTAVWSDGTIKARLLDCHGWTLEFVGPDRDPEHIVLKGRVAHFGEELPPWFDDKGLRASYSLLGQSTLMNRNALGAFPLVLSLRDGEWAGWVGGGAFATIHLTAKPDGPGRMILRGQG